MHIEVLCPDATEYSTVQVYEAALGYNFGLMDSYDDFFINFVQLVKERCFCKCVRHLREGLSYEINTLLRVWGSQLFNQSYLTFINKYFDISSFYTYIYKELDYDFFVGFDEYLKEYDIYNGLSKEYCFNRIKFLDLFDKRFSREHNEGYLYYKYANPRYSILNDAGFSSTDGLKLLACFKNNEESKKIFSYLLSKYRFEFMDVIELLRQFINDNNTENMTIFLDKYVLPNRNNLSSMFIVSNLDFHGVAYRELTALLNSTSINCECESWRMLHQSLWVGF